MEVREGRVSISQLYGGDAERPDITTSIVGRVQLLLTRDYLQQTEDDGNTKNTDTATCMSHVRCANLMVTFVLEYKVLRYPVIQHILLDSCCMRTKVVKFGPTSLLKSKYVFICIFLCCQTLHAHTHTHAVY